PVLDERLLPMGLAEGCRLKRDVGQDETLSLDDVDVPAGRRIDELYAEMARHFFDADIFEPKQANSAG
ncbi:MAG: hypothetical protein AAGJ29_13855, partial [Pseudomonadota bacterium]